MSFYRTFNIGYLFELLRKKKNLPSLVKRFFTIHQLRRTLESRTYYKLEYEIDFTLYESHLNK